MISPPDHEHPPVQLQSLWYVKVSWKMHHHKSKQHVGPVELLSWCPARTACMLKRINAVCAEQSQREGRPSIKQEDHCYSGELPDDCVRGRFIGSNQGFSILPCLCRVAHGMRRLFVCLVWLILLSVPAAGFTCVLPRLMSGPLLALNIAWSAFLAVNIYYNYAAAILRHPGTQQPKRPSIHSGTMSEAAQDYVIPAQRGHYAFTLCKAQRIGSSLCSSSN